MEIKIGLVVIFGLLVIYGAVRLYHAYMANMEKIEDVEKSNGELARTLEDLVKRINDLEKASKLRLPYQSFEAIMDGLAALDARQREVQFEDSLIENARGHLAKALAAGTKRGQK